MNISIFKLISSDSKEDLINDFNDKINTKSESTRNLFLEEKNIKIMNLSYKNEAPTPTPVNWFKIVESIESIDNTSLEENSSKYDEEVFKVKPDPVSTLLLIEIDDSIYVISFGYGYHMIKPEYIDKNFPISFLKSINLANYKLGSFIQPFYRENKLLVSYNEVENIESNIGQFLTTLTATAKSLNKDLYGDNGNIISLSNTVAASNSLAINIKKFKNDSLREKQSSLIQEIILLLMKIENRISNSRNINNFFMLEKVSNDMEVLLQSKLFSDLKEGEYDELSTYYENFTINNLGSIETIYDVENLEIYFNNKTFETGQSLLNDIIKYSIETKKEIEDILCNLHIKWENNKKKFNLLKYITAFIDSDNKKYLLSNGIWYEMDYLILEDLKERMKEMGVCSRKTDLKKYDFINLYEKLNKQKAEDRKVFSYFEAQYNSTMSEKQDNILLDREITKNSKIEVSDLAYKENGNWTLSFVKCGLGNDGMSKNINQALTSAVLLIMEDKEYIDFLKNRGINNEEIKTFELKFLVENENISENYFEELNDHTSSRFQLTNLKQKLSNKNIELKIIIENIGDLKKETESLKLKK